jgi:NAD kinase
MYFKNILIIQKTSKLVYLVKKYGYESVKKSQEFDILKNSMEMHNSNCEKFLNNLNKYKECGQTIDTINDDFLDNEKLKNEIQNKNRDLIFTLGGDGTFLRAAHFIEKDDTLLIGVNTDSKYSKGFYCPILAQDHLEESHNNNENKGKNIFTKLKENDFKEKYLNQISVESKNNKYNFINDLYIGEKFLGRISKNNLKVDDKKSETVKSSGIIFSTCKN